MQTCLSDKMPPKKVKIKKRKKMGLENSFFILTFFGGIRKKWDLANLENSFLILTFFGGILSLRQVCFFEISLKFLIFLYPI